MGAIPSRQGEPSLPCSTEKLPSVQLRADWLFAVAQRLQALADLGTSAWDPRREAEYEQIARTLPEPHSPLEELLLRGFLLDLFRRRLGLTADVFLRVALGPFAKFLTPRQRGADVHPRDIDRIDEFLEAHLQEPLTLATLARSLGTTSRHLEWAFKEAHGLTVHKYLKQRRALLALDLLRDPATKTEFVHEQVGYRSRSAFYRAFRQTFGRSPAQMRREVA